MVLRRRWRWSGFTTLNLTRCRQMAWLTALICDWRSLFVRLANPDRHRSTHRQARSVSYIIIPLVMIREQVWYRSAPRSDQITWRLINSRKSPSALANSLNVPL